MAQPKRIIHTVRERPPLREDRRIIDRSIRHDVPRLAFGKVDGDHVPSKRFDVKTDEAARGSHLEDPLAAKINASEVFGDPGSQVPFAANGSDARVEHNISRGRAAMIQATMLYGHPTDPDAFRAYWTSNICA